jgi:hypothetical protein
MKARPVLNAKSKFKTTVNNLTEAECGLAILRLRRFVVHSSLGIFG